MLFLWFSFPPRIPPRATAHTFPMLTLFLRAIFMYLFVFAILRLTGKRQVADLQPFDLLITLLIADLAGSSIANTDTPLLYSIVPILGMYVVQQALTRVCLKNARLRRVVCGSPVILVRDGKLLETAMRDNDYTIVDLLDQLRSRDVFDIRQVAFAILETNGTMSVMQKGAFQTPTMGDLNLPSANASLCELLILDGKFCYDAMARLCLSMEDIRHIVKDFCDAAVSDVFYLHRSPDGAFVMQLKAKAGAQCFFSEES